MAIFPLGRGVMDDDYFSPRMDGWRSSRCFLLSPFVSQKVERQWSFGRSRFDDRDRRVQNQFVPLCFNITMNRAPSPPSLIRSEIHSRKLQCRMSLHFVSIEAAKFERQLCIILRSCLGRILITEVILGTHERILSRRRRRCLITEREPKKQPTNANKNRRNSRCRCFCPSFLVSETHLFEEKIIYCLP